MNDSPVVITQRDRVIAWHEKNGGRNGRLAGHALRLLHETIELCIACGAGLDEINERVNYEIAKAIKKKDFDSPVTIDNAREEMADVSFLLDVLAHRTGNADLTGVRETKLAVLDGREWEADNDGVLWRPGHIPVCAR